jgi:hypothetical protein
MPPKFVFPANQAIWMPIQQDASKERGSGQWMEIVGRLRPGVSFDAASADIAGIAKRSLPSTSRRTRV